MRYDAPTRTAKVKRLKIPNADKGESTTGIYTLLGRMVSNFQITVQKHFSISYKVKHTHTL